MRISRAVVAVMAGLAAGASAWRVDAAEPSASQVEEIVVVAAPLRGAQFDPELLPVNPQTGDAAEIRNSMTAGLPGFLDHEMASVHRNEAQANPLQPDLWYRGYVASPVLGVPQGLAVYQNGVRLNETFGDTVNWDLIPETAIADVEILPGSDPLFGLNALGGAIVIRTKNGFTHPGNRAELFGGSFGRVDLALESGANDGRFGYYTNMQLFREGGWREESQSWALNFFSTLGWRGDRSAVDLNLGFADTDLNGNGATPVQLLAMDRSAVFTFPDNTKNLMQSYSLEATHRLSDDWSATALGYYRGVDTDTFNGDGTEFVDCELPENEGLLCEEEGVGTPDEEVVTDQDGDPASDDLNAINNRSTTDQNAYGFAFQTRWDHPALALVSEDGDRDGETDADVEQTGTLIAGASFDGGTARFSSSVELASLTPRRGTDGTGRFVPAQAVAVNTDKGTWGLYATEVFPLTTDLTLNVGGRLNFAHIELRDRSGESPELDGSHDYVHANPVVGLRYRIVPALTAFVAYRESSRTPSPVELACADPDAPCNLPNAFLADPPLDQVIARTGEIGFRGGVPRGPLGTSARWQVSGFYSRNQDDIIFISTGGLTSNEGFFDNVGDTLRRGVELFASGRVDALPVGWHLGYSWVLATFEDPFAESSPNNPDADPEGDIQVEPGDRIPSIPENILKAGIDWFPIEQVRLGIGMRFYSDQFLRGDEANLLDPIDPYAVLDLSAEWQIDEHFAVRGRIENVLDTDYETFGLLGDPSSVLGPDFTNPRFVSPGAPIGGWVGVTASF